MIPESLVIVNQQEFLKMACTLLQPIQNRAPELSEAIPMKLQYYSKTSVTPGVGMG